MYSYYIIRIVLTQVFRPLSLQSILMRTPFQWRKWNLKKWYTVGVRHRYLLSHHQLHLRPCPLVIIWSWRHPVVALTLLTMIFLRCSWKTENGPRMCSQLSSFGLETSLTFGLFLRGVLSMHYEKSSRLSSQNSLACRTSAQTCQFLVW